MIKYFYLYTKERKIMKKKLFFYIQNEKKKQIGNLHFVNKYGFLDLFQNAAENKKKRKKKKETDKKRKTQKLKSLFYFI